MNLKEFIANTLVSIKEGIEKANSGESGNYYITSNSQVVNFDVAVEVAEEKGKDRSGGLAIKVVEAKIRGSTRMKESNISRINFTVGVKKVIQ